MIMYESYVKPMLARNEQSIRALDRLNRDAAEVLQAVLPQGISRLFELLAKVIVYFAYHISYIFV